VPEARREAVGRDRRAEQAAEELDVLGDRPSPPGKTQKRTRPGRRQVCARRVRKCRSPSARLTRRTGPSDVPRLRAQLACGDWKRTTTLLRSRRPRGRNRTSTRSGHDVRG
jgi:hypothetical protein